MSYPPQDVVVWLGEQCLNLTPGINLFSGEWGENEDSIDEQVLVLDSPVTASELKDQYETVGIQVLVRGARHKGAATTYSLAKSISDALLAPLSAIEMNCTCYTDWEEVSNIAGLGKDSNDRHVFSMNFSSNRNR